MVGSYSSLPNINISGGHGSNGQNGGNGENGSNGVNATDVDLNDIVIE